MIEPIPDSPDGTVMTVVEHLSELRRRIFIGLLAVVLGTIVGFLLAPEALRILKAPLGIPAPLVFTAPGGALFLQLKLALMIGIALASPVILYELWAFVSPGLTPRERRMARPWIPLALVFLVLGVTVAYVILPYTVSFLLGFAIPGTVEPLITTDAYFGFVTTMFLAFGLVMQFPIVLVLLSKVGIVDAERLRRGRRYVFVGIFVLAVVVTPGGDPFSPTIMAMVMYPLYELTIRLVARSSSRD
ncbi:MAG TPA: twin-arginine translocase subunit TatC [Candidatus Limnocylindrales bacterium]|nr:twin-arginine translocase subunit TatC [Candidatus Limnocylindrales bacterium]